ncbi:MULTISPECIES: hypothetical protein [unclassified Streptomyces]|uniref:hypothetical protein n=1 Tax=unclassified Streptomyces TaxID=2593676 RepID=UPI003812D284
MNIAVGVILAVFGTFLAVFGPKLSASVGQVKGGAMGKSNNVAFMVIGAAIAAFGLLYAFGVL